MTDVRVATRKHLELISSDIQTSWEGEKFTPTTSSPYQRVELLSGFTEDLTFDSIQIGNHILQVTLYYPSNKGVYDVETKASEIQNHFLKDTKLTKNDTCARVVNTPSIANLGTIDDRVIRVITINLKTGV